MAQIQHVTDVVELDGFQAILKPSQFGYTLSCIVDEAFMEAVIAEREELLEKARLKVKNQKKAKEADPTYEDLEDGRYRLKFTWDEKHLPSIIDALGTVVEDPDIRIYSGSRVRIAFTQYGYATPKHEYGVTMKNSLKGIQIIELATSPGALSHEQAANLFGVAEGGFNVESYEAAGLADDSENDEESTDEEF